MRSCFFLEVSIGGQSKVFSVKVCYRFGLFLPFNSVESWREVIYKFGSMKPIVREVGAESFNSN